MLSVFVRHSASAATMAEITTKLEYRICEGHLSISQDV